VLGFTGSKHNLAHNFGGLLCDYKGEQFYILAERARLTRAVLALALRAVAKALRRPKSLPAILSNSLFGGEGEIRTREGREALPVFKSC
jgi:hypothetical protein